ncbi:MAG TPA: serine hydrolase domain-containing protein [Solirubrobacterales bacterium]|nr:serine hydrolase domain-containing protein [Solirubrobacterales bacterium]
MLVRLAGAVMVAIVATVASAAGVAGVPTRAGAAPVAGGDSVVARLGRVADGLTSDAFVGANLLGEQQAFVVPGTVLTLSRPGQATVTVAAGLSDVAAGISMRPAMPQPVGSGTKPMTAVAVLRLVEAGRLSLDTPLPVLAARHRRDGGHLARLVAAHRGRLRAVTLRELLAMTSGIADYDESPGYGAALAAHPHRRFSLARLASYGLELPAAFPPGAGRHTLYSNTNYVLAAMVAEATSGRPFEDLLRVVWRRAGMSGTSYGSPPGRPVCGYQAAYPAGTRLPAILRALAAGPTLTLERTPAALLQARAPGAERGPTTTIEAATAAQRRRYEGVDTWPLEETGGAYRLLAIGGPAGGVSSTSEDLARFWRALFSGHLLDPAMLRRLRAPVPAPPDAPGVTNFYGLGVQRQDLARDALWPGSPPLRVWYKLGDVFGYTSAAYFVEGRPFDRWVVTNTTNLFPSPVGDLGLLRDTLRALRGRAASRGSSRPPARW